MLCFLSVWHNYDSNKMRRRSSDEVDKAQKIDCMRSGNPNIKYHTIFSSNSFVRLHLVNEQQAYNCIIHMGFAL